MKKRYRLPKYKRNVYSYNSDANSSPEKNVHEQPSLSSYNLGNDGDEFVTLSPSLSIHDRCSSGVAGTSETQRGLSLGLTQESGLNASVSEFLYKIADNTAAKLAELRRTKIEEDEVETMPEKLVNDIHLLLDRQVQNAAKEFFSEDAWLLVTNTLNVLQDKVAVNLQRNYDFEPCSQNKKGKALCGSKGIRKKRKLDEENKSLKVRLTDISSVKDLSKYMGKAKKVVRKV